MPSGQATATGITDTGQQITISDPTVSYDTLLAQQATTTTSTGNSQALLNALMWTSQGISGVGSMVSAYNQAAAQRAAGEFNASIYETNSRLAQIRAADAIRRGEIEAKKAKQAAKRLIGSQRAALGAQGIDIESGSALDIQMETAELGAMDAMEIKNNAWREAWGYKVSAEDYSSRAAFAKSSGEQAARSTMLTGGLDFAKSVAAGAYYSRRNATIYDYLSEGGY